MARKLEFDYDKAIEKATLLFWQKGYTNTSLRDLLKAMKIGEGSFYNSLKSKKKLYLECLKHYNDTVTHRRLAALLSGKTVKEGIRAFFRVVLDELGDPKTPRVCLMAASLSGDVLAERDLRQYVISELETFSQCFIERLDAAKLQGELSLHFDVEAASGLIFTYLQGLFRTIRVLHQRAQAEKQIEALLTGLGL